MYCAVIQSAQEEQGLKPIEGASLGGGATLLCMTPHNERTINDTALESPARPGPWCQGLVQGMAPGISIWCQAWLLAKRRA